MLGGPQPAEPRFWKALFVTALFTISLSLVLRAFVHMSDLAWLLVLLASTAVVASLVNARMKHDWRAADTMRMQTFDRRTQTTRGIWKR